MNKGRWAAAFLTLMLVAKKVSEILFAAGQVIYTEGPTFFGGWEGQPHQDICARLTATPAATWRLHGLETATEACEELIMRKVKANLIGVAMMAMAAGLWQLTSVLWHYCTLKLIWSDVSALQSCVAPPPRRLRLPP